MNAYSAPSPMPQQYGAPQYGAPQQYGGGWQRPTLDQTLAMPGYVERPTNTMALISLLVVASGWVITGPIGIIVGAVLAFIGLNQIKQRHEDGAELAWSAIIAAGLSVIFGIMIIVSFFSFVSSMFEMSY